jgi:hypothetical protein
MRLFLFKSAVQIFGAKSIDIIRYARLNMGKVGLGRGCILSACGWFRSVDVCAGVMKQLKHARLL